MSPAACCSVAFLPIFLYFVENISMSFAESMAAHFILKNIN